MKKILILILTALIFTGCSLYVGRKEVPIYDQYPVYPVFDIPELKNISGEELTPYKKITVFIENISEKLSTQEKAELEKLIAEAESNQNVGREKVKENIEKLLKWGKKNEATVVSYNQYAVEKNERIEFFSEK